MILAARNAESAGGGDSRSRDAQASQVAKMSLPSALALADCEQRIADRIGALWAEQLADASAGWYFASSLIQHRFASQARFYGMKKSAALDGTVSLATPNNGSNSVHDALFGRLAVLTGFIDHEELDQANSQQKTAPSASLADILV